MNFYKQLTSNKFNWSELLRHAKVNCFGIYWLNLLNWVVAYNQLIPELRNLPHQIGQRENDFGNKKFKKMMLR